MFVALGRRLSTCPLRDETRGDALFEGKTNLITICEDVANVIMTPAFEAVAWLPDSEEDCGNYLPMSRRIKHLEDADCLQSQLHVCSQIKTMATGNKKNVYV